MAYVYVADLNHLIFNYFTFFGTSFAGATPGIRIEVVIFLIGAYLYLRLKKVSNCLSLFFTVFLYTVIFIYGTLPFFVERIFNFINVEYLYTPVLMTNFFLFFLFIFGIPALYIAYKRYFKLFIKDIRPFRIIYFISMFWLGIVFAQGFPGNEFVLTANNIFIFLFVPISIVFAGLFSIVTNNLVDLEIDKISNQNRPLVKKEIDPDLYARLGWFFFLLTAVYSFAAGFLSFFIIMLWVGNYFLYSMPPFRIKRIPFFSKLPIAFNSLILIILGFVTVSGVDVSFLPKSSILLFLVIVTSVINFVDIKDYEGDKLAGIKTLPVLLGLRRSKVVISIFFAIHYLLVVFLAKDWITLILFFILGCFQVYLINRKDYKEKYVFIILLGSIFYIIVKLFFF
jgi:4-hydroxybenzoate polyprenyltransferase